MAEKDYTFPKQDEYLTHLNKTRSIIQVEAYKSVILLSKMVAAENGRALLVGGSVRDILLGLDPKDFDLEVYKIPPEKLRNVVQSFGGIIEMGKAFSILRIPFGGGVDIDVSIPRMDSKISPGHRGFDVKADPNMSILDAARRRDFTINAISADPLTGEIFDPFNGKNDLGNGVLKVVDKGRFKDDPLRAMRALQLVARFSLTIEEKTRKLLMEMVPSLAELPKERMFEEWKKILLSKKPSLGLEAGMEIGIFERIYPEFGKLKETPQDKQWHPEGDVWTHTLMSVDQAARIVGREKMDDKEALVILFSTLCHD